MCVGGGGGGVCVWTGEAWNSEICLTNNPNPNLKKKHFMAGMSVVG